MIPPIEGMKTRPYGEDFMCGAWAGCLSWATSMDEIVEAFKAETGHDLRAVLTSQGINKMVDEATGHKLAVVVAWADWVTKNLWGEEES